MDFRSEWVGESRLDVSKPLSSALLILINSRHGGKMPKKIHFPVMGSGFGEYHSKLGLLPAAA